MEKKQILIVEDERIIAEDIKNSLQDLGYAVSAAVSSGEEAIKKAAENNPDLVLMDIKLKGEMDGIEAASQIRSHFNIPVVYLTAHADEKTLQQAKITEPFGYIIKPFNDQGLHVNIEMSLYKHRMEKKLKESEKWLFTTLRSIGDAVIATDRKGFVSFMNPVAEKLTGWKQENAVGKPLKTIFNIISEETGKQIEDPIAQVIQDGSTLVPPNDAILTAKDGTRLPIEESCSPIKDNKGNIIGTVLVFRDITERKQAEDMLKQDAEELERANIVLKRALDGLLKRVEQKHKPISVQREKVGAEERGGLFLYPIEDEARAHSLFISMIDAGLPTLAVIRTPPQRFREMLGRDVETVWLTNNRESDMMCLPPSNIARLSIVLTEFFNCASEGVILFEGVEYILSIVDFNDLLNLVQLLNDKIALIEGAIYMVLDLGVLDEKQARYIQRECLQPLKCGEDIVAQGKG